MSILPHQPGADLDTAIEAIAVQLPNASPWEIHALLRHVRRTLELVEGPWEAAKLVHEAEAVKYLFEKADVALEIQNQAASVAIAAKRRAGEILAARPKNPGTRGQFAGSCGSGEVLLDPPGDSPLAPAALVDLGIKPHQSRQWQKLAAIPTSVVHRFEADKKMARQIITAGGLLAYADNRRREDQADPDDGPSHRHAWELETSRRCARCGEIDRHLTGSISGQPAMVVLGDRAFTLSEVVEALRETVRRTQP